MSRGLVCPVPENVAAIPSPVETLSGFDPAFSLVPFLSRRYISMPRTCPIFDPTLSGYETKSPTRGLLRRLPENVTTDSSVVELSSGSGTSTGLFPSTRSISPPPPPPSGLLVSGGGLTVGLPNSPVTQRRLSAVPPPSLFSIWEVIPLYLLPPLPSIL